MKAQRLGGCLNLRQQKCSTTRFAINFSDFQVRWRLLLSTFLIQVALRDCEQNRQRNRLQSRAPEFSDLQNAFCSFCFSPRDWTGWRAKVWNKTMRKIKKRIWTATGKNTQHTVYTWSGKTQEKLSFVDSAQGCRLFQVQVDGGRTM